MSIGSRYKILDPVCEPEPEGATLAPRLDTLDGKVVGLYSNRVHATKFLDLVSVILSERFNLQDIVRGTYNIARVMRRDEWQDVERCDTIVLANGD